MLVRVDLCSKRLLLASAIIKKTLSTARAVALILSGNARNKNSFERAGLESGDPSVPSCQPPPQTDLLFFVIPHKFAVANFSSYSSLSCSMAVAVLSSVRPKLFAVCQPVLTSVLEVVVWLARCDSMGGLDWRELLGSKKCAWKNQKRSIAQFPSLAFRTRKEFLEEFENLLLCHCWHIRGSSIGIV